MDKKNPLLSSVFTAPISRSSSAPPEKPEPWALWANTRAPHLHPTPTRTADSAYSNADINTSPEAHENIDTSSNYNSKYNSNNYSNNNNYNNNNNNNGNNGNFNNNNNSNFNNSNSNSNYNSNTNYNSNFNNNGSFGADWSLSPVAAHPQSVASPRRRVVDLDEPPRMAGFLNAQLFAPSRASSTPVWLQDPTDRPVYPPDSPQRHNAESPAPPGLDHDPLAQALQTLSVAGMSSQQIADISAQLQRKQPVQQWSDSPWNDRARPPQRSQSAAPRPASPMHRSASPTRSPESPVRSAILDDFRANKTRKYEVRDFAGHICEFSSDQHGSRFIQQRLETCSLEDKQLMFEEIYPVALSLMTDVFGNYVIQKFFEFGAQDHKELLAALMETHVLTLSMQMYGCRVVQKAFEHVTPQRQYILIRELEGNVLKCVKDQNGNHVIQKAVERVLPEHVKFIIDAFYGQVYALATHPYGCRVIQRIFEHCEEVSTKPLLEELQRYALSLIQDQYGNYVIQHILERGRPQEKQFVIAKIKGNVLAMSKHKFASNVVEKCVTYSTPIDRNSIIIEVTTTKPDGTTPLFVMMKDQFANYVVQKLLDVASEQEKIMMVTKIKPQISSLRKFTYGKHLIAKVEKLSLMYGIE